MLSLIKSVNRVSCKCTMNDRGCTIAHCNEIDHSCVYIPAHLVLALFKP